MPYISKCSVALLVLLAVLLLGLLPASAAGGPNSVTITAIEAPEGQFPLVSLVASVTDLDGAPVTGLDASAFTVTENQVAVKDLKVEPFSADMLMGIVIDSSKSFRDSEGRVQRVDLAKKQASALVDPNNKRLQPGDQVAVFAFKNGQPTTVLDFSADHNQVLDLGVGKVDTAGNEKTALFDIVRKSVDAIVTPQAYRRVLLIISDGYDTTSSVDLDPVIQRAQQAHVVIHTVGLCSTCKLAPDQEGSRFLRRLALETGGQYIWYRPTQPDADKTMSQFLNALADQRQMRRLTYTSAQCSAGPSEVRLMVQTGGRQLEDSVTFQVPPFAPKVSLQGITNGQVVRDKQKVSLGVACASIPISKVEFLLDGKVVYTTDAQPFEFDWDTQPTARQLGATTSVPKPVKVTAKAYADKYTVETPAVTVGVVIYVDNVEPTPNPCDQGNFLEKQVYVLSHPATCSGFFPAMTSLIALAVAIIAVVLLVILIRRGAMRRVGFVVGEGARRVTRIFQRRTDIKGPSGVVVKSSCLACLILESEPFRGKRSRINEPDVLLGSDPERSGIVFDWDDYVSGRHAKIRNVDGHFYLWDMRSRNGTWVDDRRVIKSTTDGMNMAEAVELHDQSHIRLGPDLRLCFYVGDGPDAAGASSAVPSPSLDVSAQGKPASGTEAMASPLHPTDVQLAGETGIPPSRSAVPGAKTERLEGPDQ